MLWYRVAVLSIGATLAGCEPPADLLDATDHDGGMSDAPELDAPSDLDAFIAPDGGPDDTGRSRAPIDAARDRLLASYLAHLMAHAGERHSNGLDGAELTDVCGMWSRMTPSSRGVFLTITHRLGGSVLASDGSTALDHVTALHRVAGGTGETPTSPGACGGDGNRLFMSIDATLHAALLAAYDRRGARGPGGLYDLSDVVPSSFWRNSRDLAGAHEPFTVSLETEGGAPRGQVHFFRDPASGAATSPLGRTDVASVIDPYALEMDLDYDCVHSSNPLCEYTLYGPACLPRPRRTGLDIYGDNYGVVDPSWMPGGC